MVALAALGEDLAPGKGWVLGAPQDRKRRLAREAQSRKLEARRAVAEVREAAREMGSAVWSATDPGDLADLLDASVDDAPMIERARKVQGALFRAHLDEVPDFASFARAIDGKTVSDGSIVPDLLEGIRIVSVVVELLENHRAEPAPEAGAAALDAVDDYALPVPLLRCRLAMDRALVCLAAFVDLIVSDRRTPPKWLLKQVVRCWVDGQRAVLRTVVMVYGNVPQDLLPAADRLDREELMRAHDEGGAVFEQFIAGAVALQ